LLALKLVSAIFIGMDELMISGRRYLSAVRAAKEHGYHSDYIGQLIRGGKVRGQKVGRAWYVDGESLAVYLGKEIPAGAVAAAQQQKQNEEPSAPAKEPVVVEELAPVVIQKEEPKEEHTEPVAVVEIKKIQATPVVPITPAAEPEVRAVSITKVAPPEEDNAPQQFVEEKSSGLRYVSDDEPMLPRITKERVVLNESVERPVFAAPLPVRAELSSSGNIARASALVALGVVVLVAVATLSSLLVFRMSVGSTQASGVQFSLPQ
jgi:hypothetical protein